MKKSLLLFLLSLGALSARADGIKTSNQRVVVHERTLDVHFDVSVDRRAVRGSDVLIYRPGITDGTSRWALPEIVVRGRRGRLADARRAWVSGRQTLSGEAVKTENGRVFSYSASVDRQPWMSRARVQAEAIIMGCCSQSVAGPVLLAMVPDFTPEPPVIAPSSTTGERLAKDVNWVLPETDFDPRTFDRDREESLRILFPWDSYVLERSRGRNGEVLDRLVAAINRIEASGDSRVTGIAVAGYASPEGSIEHNERLARNRATALKLYLTSHTGVSAEKIRLYNGAEDWAGLRIMVEASRMPERAEILRIIDTVPIWDARTRRGRQNELMELHGGTSYRYMLRHFFPELRSAAYIKVFYENK